MASQQCTWQQYGGKTACPRSQKPLPAHGQDLQEDSSYGRASVLQRRETRQPHRAEMSLLSLWDKPLHVQLRAQHPVYRENIQALPGKPALKWEVVTLVTPPTHSIEVPRFCAETHANEERCRHSQGAQREATSQPTRLATFRDDLYGTRTSWSVTCVLALLLGWQSIN